MVLASATAQRDLDHLGGVVHVVRDQLDLHVGPGQRDPGQARVAPPEVGHPVEQVRHRAGARVEQRVGLLDAGPGASGLHDKTLPGAPGRHLGRVVELGRDGDRPQRPGRQERLHDGLVRGAQVLGPVDAAMMRGQERPSACTPTTWHAAAGSMRTASIDLQLPHHVLGRVGDDGGLHGERTVALQRPQRGQEAVVPGLVRSRRRRSRSAWRSISPGSAYPEAPGPAGLIPARAITPSSTSTSPAPGHPR